MVSDIDTPLVCVVVLNYNGQPHNAQCLHSVIQSQYANLEVLFVDNGSTDNSLEEVKENFPQIKILENDHNLYFAAGVNRGVVKALSLGAKFVLILNNDTMIAPSAVKRLVATMQVDTGIGCCQPLITDWNNSDRIASAGCLVSISGRAWDAQAGQNVSNLDGVAVEIKGATGCAMMLSREAIEEVGLFDENYVMYYEDVDLSFRIQRAGWKVYLVPAARVVHRGGATAAEHIPLRKLYFCEVNSFRLIGNHFPGALASVGYISSVLVSLMIATKAVLTGQPSRAGVVVGGCVVGMVLGAIAYMKRAFMPHKAPLTSTCIELSTLFPPRN